MGQVPVNGKGLPAFLVLITLVPLIFGTVKGLELLIAWDWAMKFAADHVDNLPLFVHALSAMTFLVGGAIQMLPGLRFRKPHYHRRAGRVVALAGLLGALSGVWMTLSHAEISSQLLFYGRLIFGTLWAVFILLAVRAIIRRNIQRHRAFMIRAFALAANAGTLPFIYLPFLAIAGEPTPLVDEIIQTGGWVINLAVAEWLIRRPRRKPQVFLQHATV